jgi:molecular chaperone GrpE (heat shock protein)
MSGTKTDISEEIPSLPDNEKAEEVTKAFRAFLMEPLQKVSLKLEGLSTEMENRDDRIHQLEDRVQKLEAKFDEICLLLKQIEPRSHPVEADEEIVLADPVLDIQALAAQAKAEEEQYLDEDRQSIALALEAAGFWLERGKRLRRMIEAAAGAADEVVANSNKILESLPEELNQALESSQQGLNIIGRMLQRLVNQDDRLEGLAEEIEFSGNLQALEEGEWLKLLEGETKEKSAQQKIRKKLDTIRRSNYKLVSNAGDIADKLQKGWLDFIQKQVLPILDGICDGKKHTATLIDELKGHHQESESALGDWFGTYLTLSSTLLTMLNDLGVYRMDIAPGMTIDFERHEPSCVEADPDMENEQIKEISRDGYDYAAQNGNRQTLRVARVVVVKNDG